MQLRYHPTKKTKKNGEREKSAILGCSVLGEKKTNYNKN
uniref:Uncharacterized protein n=1 Tax=Rhizophora mucronata TaxID=61149 RepID=A0A2P2QK18_RHIMU